MSKKRKKLIAEYLDKYKTQFLEGLITREEYLNAQRKINKIFYS
jgi:hypothetical protein